jgi:N utilization substance protein B
VEEMPEQVRLFFDDDEITFTKKDEDYISGKYQKVQELIPEIDKIINENTENWSTARIGKVELTVLRLAVYELLYDDDIPDGVAIDEAVEIAKTYGQENSGGFVNAILSKIVKKGD